MNMDVDLKKIVGQRLQMLRLENNLTQEQMAESLSLSTSAYCKIEYGETDLTLTRLNKIAEILKMSSPELFNKIDSSNYPNNSETIGASIAMNNSTANASSCDDLRELIRANSLLIEILCKRIDDLEKQVKG